VSKTPTAGAGALVLVVTKKASNHSQRNVSEFVRAACCAGSIGGNCGRRAYEVSNILGAGFLEKMYERALIEELSLRGLRVKAKAPFPVAYKGKHIGTYAADLVVEDLLPVEVKCIDQFSNEHLAQCVNYLKASGLHLALLIKFRRPESRMATYGSQSLIRVHPRVFAAQSLVPHA
jgi:GxxExxY protein